MQVLSPKEDKKGLQGQVDGTCLNMFHHNNRVWCSCK
jgi:hypothetical protein